MSNDDRRCAKCGKPPGACECDVQSPDAPHIACARCGREVETVNGFCDSCRRSLDTTNPKDPSPEAKLSELRSQVSVFADKLQRAVNNRETIQGEMFDWFDDIVETAKLSQRVISGYATLPGDDFSMLDATKPPDMSGHYGSLSVEPQEDPPELRS